MSKLITRYLHWIGKHHQEKWFDMTRRILQGNFCAVPREVLCFVKISVIIVKNLKNLTLQKEEFVLSL